MTNLDRSNRSFNLHDLKQLVRMMEEAREFVTKHGSTHFDAELYSPDGYIIGDVWWDSDAEAIHFDPARYGEA